MLKKSAPLIITLLLATNALAEGGGQGGMGGGAGGADSVIGSGEAGSDGYASGSYGRTGGGGGGAGISGGNGGDGAAGPSDFAVGGSGGVGFGSSGTNGSDSATGTGGGAGGGGGGAAGAEITIISTNSGVISGGGGGSGGAGITYPYSSSNIMGGGGGGGAGGYGAIVNSGITLTNSGVISGGNGGNGGIGPSSYYSYMSGKGGSGGVGIYLGNNANLINTHIINGGQGGQGVGQPGDVASASGSNGPAVYIGSGSTSSITNTGTITSGGSSAFDIQNAGTLSSLNNLQGASSLALNFSNNLPTIYNIIVNSPSDYGKIVFTGISGTTNFGIYSTSIVDTSAVYTDVIDGLTASELNNITSGTVTLSEGSYNWSLTDANSDLVWDLSFIALPPSVANTLASMTTPSQAIGSQIAGFAMSTNYANMNTYDCGLFDQDGGCFSVGGRYSDVNGNNNTDSSSSALVSVGGYKLNNHFRVAGFIDQQVNSSTPNGITLDNKGPMVGMSLVWNQHPDHLGYQVKVANAYQSKDLSITRIATGDAEAGRGNTSMEVQSYVAEVSYQFSDGVKTAYRPYVALRRAIIKQDGYTETDVDNPLTFNTLEDKSTTVIMGMKVKYKLSNQVTLNGALGVEHDVDNDIDKLQATSTTITGLTAVDINSSINKTRPVATLGATYHISPNQTLSAQTQYQELAYTSTSAKTAYVNYTVGF